MSVRTCLKISGCLMLRDLHRFCPNKCHSWNAGLTSVSFSSVTTRHLRSRPPLSPPQPQVMIILPNVASYIAHHAIHCSRVHCHAWHVTLLSSAIVSCSFGRDRSRAQDGHAACSRVIITGSCSSATNCTSIISNISNRCISTCFSSIVHCCPFSGARFAGNLVCCCRHSRFRFPHGFKFNGRLLFSNRLLSMSADVLCSAPKHCLI